MAYKEIVQYRAIREADIQKDSGKTLRGATIHALFLCPFLLGHFTKIQADLRI
jgi:hypothetical protein